MRVSLATALVLVMFSITASATDLGTLGNHDNWVTNATRIAGTGGDYAGVSALDGLTGDDLTDGAINIDSGDIFELTIGPGIVNTPLAGDLIILDGRFSEDGVFLEINGEQDYIHPWDFQDTGLDFVLKNTQFEFSLFGAVVDLDAFHVPDNAIIHTIRMWGDDGSGGEGDIIGLTGMGQAQVVPEPATMALLGLGMAGLGYRNRRKLVG